MTVVVTGGAGFVGSHLVHALAARGFAPRVIERPGTQTDHLPPSVEVIFADIRDRPSIRSALRGAQHVYHLAANPQLWTRRRSDFRAVNFLGTVHVLDEALTAGASRVLHCSTESILTRSRQTAPIAEDQPVPLRDVIGPYCRSKWFAERHAFRLAASGAPVLVVNPTLPVGPGDRGRSPPTQMMLDFCSGKRSAYLDAELNLIDVRDVAAGMVAAMDHGWPGRRYLLGAENWSVKRVFDFLAVETGLPPPRWAVPYSAALAAAYASEAWADWVSHEMPAASITGVKLTRRRMHFDPSRTWAELGMTPRPVADAVREAVAGFRSAGWLSPSATRPAPV